VPSNHEMILAETRDTGAEEWWCPTCGRRMMLRWEPFEKVVLGRGNEWAVHTGGRGGVSIGQVQVEQLESPPAEQQGERGWPQWLEDIAVDREGPAA
jgi:hypothetical protein